MGAHRFGYAGMNTALKLSTNRTCRLQNVTEARLTALIDENLTALETIMRWNVTHGIGLFRMGSGLIPFGSHPATQTFAWHEVFADTFRRIGQEAAAWQLRLSMHPGQYVNINSPTPRVLDDSIADLVYHARVFKAMALPATSKMVIHVGGLYGDKLGALKRFIHQYEELPQSVKDHLVLEHDDKIFTFADVYRVYDETGIPLVFDTLHHQLNHEDTADARNLRRLLERCFSTWDPVRDGRPKIHFASQAPGQAPGAHATEIDTGDFLAFYSETSDLDYDVMFECKDKEQSVLRIMQALQAFDLTSPPLTPAAPQLSEMQAEKMPHGSPSTVRVLSGASFTSDNPAGSHPQNPT